MQKKWTWVVVGGVVLIVVVGLIVGLSLRSSSNKNSAGNSVKTPAESGGEPHKFPDPKPVKSPTRDEPPVGVTPSQATKQAGGETSPYVRSFTVSVQNGSVSPSDIVVYVGDILTATFISKDRAYEFVQPDHGLSWTVPAGGSKSFQFQAMNTGKFTFYCPSCGGPSKGPVGYITAVAK